VFTGLFPDGLGVCMCVCVCARERERERERTHTRQLWAASNNVRVCLCVRVCVCVCVCTSGCMRLCSFSAPLSFISKFFQQNTAALSATAVNSSTIPTNMLSRDSGSVFCCYFCCVVLCWVVLFCVVTMRGLRVVGSLRL